MTAEELLRDGKLADALAALTQQVRAQPADAKLRTFLFQLLAVEGKWQRALTQLGIAGELDPATLVMVQMYREAIQCELLRAEIFAGKRSPLIFGQPEEWLALLLQSQNLTADGKYSQADELRERAFESAPTTSGSLEIETSNPGGDPTSTSVPFEWLADADSRFGPVLEAIVSGRYYWVPLARVKTVVVERPADLRDFVWLPVHFVWANGGDAVGLIPSRYPGSEQNPDEAVRLARKTDWTEASGGTVLGQGQRMLATDAGEYALLDVRKINLNVEAAAADAAATHG